MSEPKKPQTPVWPLPPTPSKAVDSKKPENEGRGRVVHDARGNAVWSWTGKLDNDSTTHLLRKLESPELALADDAVPQTRGGPSVPGIDPYHQRNERRTSTPPRSGEPAKEPEEKAPKDSVLRQLTGKR